MKELDTADDQLREFLELDLEILASPEERYVEYSKQIEMEYSPAVYAPAEFKSGRAKFLEKILPGLEAGQVFRAKEKNEKAACNVKREIESLKR